MARSVLSNNTTFFSVEIINICTAHAWPVQDKTPPGVRVDRGLRLFPALGMCSSPQFSRLTRKAGVGHQEISISGTGSTGAASLVINETASHQRSPTCRHQDCRRSTEPPVTQMPSSLHSVFSFLPEGRLKRAVPRCDELCPSGCWASSGSAAAPSRCPLPAATSSALSLSCSVAACHPNPAAGAAGPSSPHAWSGSLLPHWDRGAGTCPRSPNASNLHCQLATALASPFYAAELRLCRKLTRTEVTVVPSSHLMNSRWDTSESFLCC